jgi:hypothetical protein
MKNILVVSFTLVIGLVVSNVSMAESVRCGSKLVYIGDSLYTVKSKCGEPDDARHHTETRTVSRRISEPCASNSRETRCSSTVEDTYSIEVDELTYDFGISRFVETLRFEDGKLVRITDGDYGKKQGP